MLIGRRPTIRGRVTQFGFGAFLSQKFLHLSDPTTFDRFHIAPSLLSWIDIDGIHDPDVISGIGERYDIHSLVQTDITTTEQRTKLDVLDDALFLVCKSIS
ncbi:unnamed protein product [Rotaria sp. Silwood1]|nr:unnamed protein product [Rotaria sp. Silwood1]